MRLAELVIVYERRRLEAHRQRSQAPLEAVYGAVLEELRALDGFETPDRMMNTAEAAGVLAVAPKTVAKWAAEGRFPRAQKTSECGEWRIPAREVYGLAGHPTPHQAKRPRLWTEGSDV